MTDLNEQLKAQLDTATYQALARAYMARVKAAEAAGYDRARSERPIPVLVADTLRGMARSWTGWFGAGLVALPEILPALQHSIPGIEQQLTEILGGAAAHRVIQWIGLAVILLRLKTNASLADKGRP